MAPPRKKRLSAAEIQAQAQDEIDREFAEPRLRYSSSRPMTEADKQLIMAGKPLPRPVDAPPPNPYEEEEPPDSTWASSAAAATPSFQPQVAAPPKRSGQPAPTPSGRVIDVSGPEIRQNAPHRTPESQLAGSAYSYTRSGSDGTRQYGDTAQRMFARDSAGQRPDMYGYDDESGYDRSQRWEDDYLQNVQTPGKDLSWLTTLLHGHEAGEKARNDYAQRQQLYQQGLNNARQAGLRSDQQAQDYHEANLGRIEKRLGSEDDMLQSERWLEQQKRNMQGKTTRTTDSLTDTDWNAVQLNISDNVIKRAGVNIDPRVLADFARSDNDVSTLPPEVRRLASDDIWWRAHTGALNTVTSTATQRAQLTPDVAGNASAVKKRRELPFTSTTISKTSELENIMRSAAKARDAWRQLPQDAREAFVRAAPSGLASVYADYKLRKYAKLTGPLWNIVNDYVKKYNGVAVNGGEAQRSANRFGMTADGFSPWKSPAGFEAFLHDTNEAAYADWERDKKLQSDLGQGM